MSKVIVTAGPSFEPIDEVRCLTNFSTGDLGVRLANALSRAGFGVFCLKGVASTTRTELLGCRELSFTTNDDLHRSLVRLAREHRIDALLHVAALCDYKVSHVTDARGSRQDAAKIESRAGELTIALEPARKVIAGMRAHFPKAVIVGWKYELNGTRADALARAWRQIREARTDACVLNGRAWGDGFAFCTPPDQIEELPDRPALIEFLPRWLEQFKRPGVAVAHGARRR